MRAASVSDGEEEEEEEEEEAATGLLGSFHLPPGRAPSA